MTGIFITKPLTEKDLYKFSKIFISELIDISCNGKFKDDEPIEKRITIEYFVSDYFRKDEGEDWTITDYDESFTSLSGGGREYADTKTILKLINSYVRKLKTHDTLWIVGKIATKEEIAKRIRNGELHAKKTTTRKTPKRRTHKY